MSNGGLCGIHSYNGSQHGRLTRGRHKIFLHTLFDVIIPLLEWFFTVDQSMRINFKERRFLTLKKCDLMPQNGSIKS